MFGLDGVDVFGEFFGLFVVGEFGFYLDGVVVRGVGDGVVDGVVVVVFEMVVVFVGVGGVLVEVNVFVEDVVGDGVGFFVGELFVVDVVVVFLGEGFLVGEVGGEDGVYDVVVEVFEVGFGELLVFDGLEFGVVFVGFFISNYEFVEVGEVGVVGVEDEGVVVGIDGGGDEGGSFGISMGNG